MADKEMRCFNENLRWIYSVCFNPDGQKILSSGGDGTVRLWDVDTGKQLHCFLGHAGAVNGLAYSRDGRRVLSAGHDGTVRLWQVSPPGK